MRKLMFLVVMLLPLLVVNAQVVNEKGIESFLDELAALKGEHVEYEEGGLEKIIDEMDVQGDVDVEDFKMILGKNVFHLNNLGVTQSGNAKIVQLTTNDDEGYNSVLKLLDRYDVVASEDFFGIPLTANNREEGEQEIVFMDAGHTLLLSDDGDEIEIVYANFNLMEILNLAFCALMDNLVEESVDVEGFGGMDFTVIKGNESNVATTGKSRYTPKADSDDIIKVAGYIYDENITTLASNGDAGKDKLAEIRESKEETLLCLSDELAELDEPSLIEIIHGTDYYCVAIPNVPEELKSKMKPYAASGVYDWINETPFSNGASFLNFDCISCIITPKDVAMQYAVRNYPREKWFDDGYPANVKEAYACEYQGGTPAVLYSFSQNEKGYTEMCSGFNHLFTLEVGDKYKNLEVVKQVKRDNGKCLVQLCGEGGELLSFYSSPADKYCHFSIVIGGTRAFEQAVNEYVFSGENNIARNINVIIDNDLSNNSYGIHFTADEYSLAGRTYKNGVHINFGYADKLNE